MSQTAEGPGWWAASDGLWYAPELHPDQEDATGAGAPAGTDAPRASVDIEVRTIEAPGGRTLEVQVAGPEWGTPLLFHHGMPFAAVPWQAAADSAARLGLRLVVWSRPGYGRSDRSPGRLVRHVAGDAAAVLKSLGRESFVTVGWSGGGPHALACAAAFADRCRAAAVLATSAPCLAVGLDWTACIPAGRAEAAELAQAGGEALRRSLGTASVRLSSATAADVPVALGASLPAVDLAALTEELAGPLAEAARAAISHGVDGWFDDSVTLFGDWGVDLSAICSPVTIWQGGVDPLVPPAHGDWLAEHVTGAVLRTLPAEGHVSPLLVHLDRVLEELAERAGISSDPH